MPPRLVQHRSSGAALVVCFAHVSSWYYLPLYLQSVCEASPVRSGALIPSIVLVQAVTGVAAGFLVHRSGLYLEPIWLGMAPTTLGFGLFIRLDASSLLFEIMLFEVIAGLGVGLVFQPPLVAFQANVPQQDVTTATALFGFVRGLSTSVSVVIGGVVFQNGMAARYARLRDVLPPETARKLSGAEAVTNVLVIRSLGPAQKELVKAMFAESLREMWILYACDAATGLVVSGFISKQTLDAEHVDTKTGITAVSGSSPVPAAEAVTVELEMGQERERRNA
jgi:Major Facilitator Superfamily